MHYIPLSIGPNGEIKIDGYPNAERIVRITGADALLLSDLNAHRDDLLFAQQCTDEINKAPANAVVRQALWRSALVYFVKCFVPNASRDSILSEKAVYADELKALPVFAYFKLLRDRHDQSPYLQSIPAAILNRQVYQPRIAEVTCMTMGANTLDQPHWSVFRPLIDKALQYVASEIDRVCDRIAEDLEHQPADVLSAMEALTIKVPKGSGVGHTRGRASPKSSAAAPYKKPR